MIGAVMAGLLSGGVSAVVRPVFQKADQPVAWFKYDGGKYPWVMVYHPGLERVTNILCGTKINGAPQPAASAADLQGLQALCCWTKYSEGNIQLEKVYRGYRESYAAKATERVLSALGFAPNATYKGTLLVDEYVAGMPQNWVLRSEDVPYIVAYLRDNFIKAGIAPLAIKPVLLLEVIEANGSVSAEDSAFLNTYFDVVTADDQEARAFFTKAGERKNDCFAATASAHTVGATVGESIMASTVDKFEKLEIKKLGGVFLGGLMIALAPEIRRLIVSPVAEHLNSTRTKIIVGSVAALVLAVAAYEFMEEAKLNAAAEKRALEAEGQKTAVVA
jgi:hypothetical protein